MGQVTILRKKERTERLPELPPKGKFSVLVVDDNDSLNEILSVYLTAQGCCVRTARDGRSALKILAAEDFHLMILDLMMPTVDGFQVLSFLKDGGKRIRPYTIVLSAMAADESEKKAYELSADEYIVKPFHLAILLDRITALRRLLD